MKKLQEIARSKGMFLSECDGVNPDRKYMITFQDSNGCDFFKTLKQIKIYLGLEEYDGIPDNIK